MPQVIYCALKGNRKRFEVVLTSFTKERILKVKKKTVRKVTLLQKRKNILYSEDNKRRKTKTRL